MPDIDMRPRPMAETLFPLRPNSRICISAPESRGAMLPVVNRGLTPISLEQVEVLPVLPVAHLQVEARDLGFLDPAVVVHESFADSVAQHLVLAQGFERLAQGAGQEIGLRLVRRI